MRPIQLGLLVAAFVATGLLLLRAFRDEEHADRWFALATVVGAAGLLVPAVLGL
jgi:hypothetical protein